MAFIKIATTVIGIATMVSILIEPKISSVFIRNSRVIDEWVSGLIKGYIGVFGTNMRRQNFVQVNWKIVSYKGPKLSACFRKNFSKTTW